MIACVNTDTPISSPGLMLSGESQALIKKLDGFKSFHTVPKDLTHATREFVKLCATPQIEQELEVLWTSCRNEFAYKRKDKINIVVERGSGILTLTDFRFHVKAEQDPGDPSCLLWIRTVDEIQDPTLLLAEPFNRCFGRVFDCIEAPFPVSQELEDIIDRLEGIKAKNITIEYPTDCSRCLVTLKELGILIEITSDRYKIKFHGAASPKVLFEKIFAFQKAILNATPENLLWFFT